jgi:hypothetical protein
MSSACDRSRFPAHHFKIVAERGCWRTMWFLSGLPYLEHLHHLVAQAIGHIDRKTSMQKDPWRKIKTDNTGESFPILFAKNLFAFIRR